MLFELQEAMISMLEQIPGVASCERYAGQLEDSARALLRVPAVLLAYGEWKPEDDPGTGQVDLELHGSLFVAVRNASGKEARANDVDALVEAILPVIRLERFGVEDVEPLQLDRVVPHYLLEGKGVGIREIRFRQSVRVGESEWDGAGVTPSDIYVGYEPVTGPDHVGDYDQVQ